MRLATKSGMMHDQGDAQQFLLFDFLSWTTSGTADSLVQVRRHFECLPRLHFNSTSFY